jgi:hypothetical protein
VWPRSAVGAGATGVGGGQGVGQNDGGFTAGRFPYLPWAVVARGGGSLGGSGPKDGRLGGNDALVLNQGEKVAMVVRGSPGSGRPLS